MRENEEIKECIKELDACYDKLYERFCGGNICTECVLQYSYQDCMLNVLQDLIEALEERKKQ